MSCVLLCALLDLGPYWFDDNMGMTREPKFQAHSSERIRDHATLA